MIVPLPLFLLFLMLALAVPVGFGMALSGVLGLYLMGGWETLHGVLTTTPLSTVSSYELITIPMFLLMAEFILVSGVADGLFRAAAAWIGRLRGGLGMATTLAGAGFAAICGTSTAAAATLSATTLPAMIKQGYEPHMAAGVVSISGTLAILIPPSVGFVIYGLIAEVNIGKLLVAGLLPAVVVTATILLTIYLLVLVNPKLAPPVEGVSWAEKFRLLRLTLPIVALFAFVTGMIYSGIATPTEAAALGALGGFFLALGSGRLTLRSFRSCLVKAVYGSAMVLMIVMGAAIFGYFFTLTQLTQELVHWVGALEVSRWVIIVVILFGYLLLGCFMDQTAILILTVPIVLPIVKSLGFDPIWFGVVKIVTAEVGLITPPIGLNCFVVARYSGMPVGEVFRGSMPHFVAHLFALAILVAFPEISLWLPSKM